MLNYGLVSTAIADDREKLQEGMQLLAEMAHKYDIPVTWAIAADAARLVANALSTWHTEYGDEPLLMLDIKPLWDENWGRLSGEPAPSVSKDIGTSASALTSLSAADMAEHLVKMRETLPQYVATEWNKIKRAMAWTVPCVAGAVWKNHVLLHALEQAGFQGLWGYRWNERDSLAAADRGCPFGCFYPSAEQHNFSAPAAGSIVGLPYLTAEHVVNNTDTLRASLLNGTAQQHYDIYVENSTWNRWLGYVQHIRATEVTQFGQETLEQLDAYFAHVAGNKNTKLLPLSEMVDDYWTNCQQTEPTYIANRVRSGKRIKPLQSRGNCHLGAKPACQDSPESAESNSTVTPEKQASTEPKRIKPLQSRGNCHLEEKAFFYYDAECQFAFVEGTMEPVEMKNYISPPVLDAAGGGVSGHNASIHGVEYHLPKVARFVPNRQRSQLYITFTIESTKVMPYGIAIWGDHGGLQLAETNTEAVTWIGKYLLFIRLALQPGNNDFEVILTI